MAGSRPVNCAKWPPGCRGAVAGFTLIELMIVVVLASIIAMIAGPSYQSDVVRSTRSAARQVLMEAAQYLERNFTTAGCYDFTDATACRNRDGAATPQPASLLRAPSEGRQSYEVTWALAGDGMGYTLTATPCGAVGASCPAGSDASFNDADCGSLTLTQTGLRGAGGSVNTCWQR